MFEFEVSNPPPHDLPILSPNVASQFRDADADITHVALIPWEEHCTECAAPQCYTSCDLFQPRADGRCRRFLSGFVRVPDVPTPQGYAVQVAFKRWGQLMAYANIEMRPSSIVTRTEKWTGRFENIARRPVMQWFGTTSKPALPARLVRLAKQRMTRRSTDQSVSPDYFLAEIHNPGTTTQNLSVCIRDANQLDHMPFQELLEVAPGFHRFKISFDRIANTVDATGDLRITLAPNLNRPEEEGMVLYFGMLTFVRDANWASKRRAAEQFAKHVKIMAWDLDNTVWNGTLVEDGIDGVELKPGVGEIIQELDRRGIINTVVSKNDEDFGMQALQKFGLAEYIVYPKISWSPKSSALQQLIQEFNIGEDAFAFIDDSSFERAEVASLLPRLRVFEETAYSELLDRAEFQPPVTTESSKRRYFYLTAQSRTNAQFQFAGDYAEFLRQCRIEMHVGSNGVEHIQRIHELVQRTNQLNFSGTRYTRDDLKRVLTSTLHDHFSIACVDKFGDYGMVGFCIVERDSLTMTDLMFSCRIQGKRVEHAFLTHIMKSYAQQGHRAFLAKYHLTDRNRPAGRVFADLGFEAIDQDGTCTTYRFDLTDPMQDDGIIAITSVDESRRAA